MNTSIKIHHKHQKPAVIIGGGLVGGLTALLLAKAGIQVTVLDASPLLEQQTVLKQRDSRVLAINQASMLLMKHADIWQNLERYQPYSGMQVWNLNSSGELNFGQPSQNLPLAQHWLGCMVEPSILNLTIQQQLLKQIVDYRPHCQVSYIEKIPHGWCIQLDNGQTITTDLIIAADGAHSTIRHQAMIQIDRFDYHQTALTGAIYTAQPHHHVARQIFLPTGPLAFLPMPDLDPSSIHGHWNSFVWTLPTDLAHEYQQLPTATLAHKITQASRYMLGEVQKIENIASFPLMARQAKHYVQDGLVLLGDAAHVIHPLAGQGVNLGCLDAAILVDYLLNDLQRGAWATMTTLHRYEHQRRRHNTITMHSMSALNWINKTPWKALQWLRNEGTNIVAKQPIIKQFFIQQASGLPALKGTRYIKDKNV